MTINSNPLYTPGQNLTPDQHSQIMGLVKDKPRTATHVGQTESDFGQETQVPIWARLNDDKFSPEIAWNRAQTTRFEGDNDYTTVDPTAGNFRITQPRNISNWGNSDTIDSWNEDGTYAGATQNAADLRGIANMALTIYGGAQMGGPGVDTTAMTNGAFLGEGAASGVGAWDAAAIKSAVAAGELGTAGSYVGQNLANGTLTDTASSLFDLGSSAPGTESTATTTAPTDGGGSSLVDKSLVKLGTNLAGTVLAENQTRPDNVDTDTAVKDQGQANLDAMNATNMGNRVNTTTPYGSQQFQAIPDPNVPGGIRWEQNITFSPEQQALYDSQTQGQLARSQMGNQMLPGLQQALGQPLNLSSMDPNALQRGATSNMRADFRGPATDPLGQMQLMDLGASPTLDRMQAGQGPQARDLYGQTGYSGSVDTVRQSVVDQFDNLNGKAFSQQLADLDNRLKNMGLTEGTEAYNREMANLRQSQGQQRNDAVQRGIQAGGAEQSRLAGIDLAADSQRFDQQQTSQFLNPLATIQANNSAAQAEYNNLLAAYNQQNTTKDAAQKNAIAISQAANDAENMRLNFGLNQTGLNNQTLRADQQTALQLAQHNDQNAILERSVPLNNYTALMTGTQATLPQFQPFGMGSATGAPVMQGAQLNQQQNIADSNRQAGYWQQGLNLFGDWLGS